MKTITVQDNTWRTLTLDKLNMGCSSIDEVILKYKNIILKIKSEEITKDGIEDIPMVDLATAKQNTGSNQKSKNNLKPKKVRSQENLATPGPASYSK